MHELALTVSLSILFTFVALIFSYILMKKLNITHPKNRFWIYAIVMMTAFSIFSFVFIATVHSHPNNGNLVDSLIGSDEEDYSLVLIIEEPQIESNHYSFVEEQKISYEPSSCTGRDKNNYLSNDATHLNDDEFVDKDRNALLCSQERFSFQCSSQRTLAFLTKFSGDPNYLLSQLLSRFQNTPSGLVDSTISPEEDVDVYGSFNGKIKKNVESADFDYYSFFINLNILLISLCILYLIFSFIFSKKIILKSVGAKKCYNSEITHLVSKLCIELKIKMPKIFIFNGNPNAFVFGFPVSLAISNELINCLSKSELEMALRHEFAHIKSRDFILKPFLQTMRILFFYNPVVHFLYYKMINERELLADSLFLKSKTDKITFMEAIVKIHGFTNYHKLLPRSIYGSCSLSLIKHNIKKLEIKDRFNHIFNKKVKKTFYTTLICMIILLSNISIIAIAQNNVLSNSLDFCEEQENERIEVNCEPLSYNKTISRIYIIRLFRDNLQLSEGYVIRDLIDDIHC